MTETEKQNVPKLRFPGFEGAGNTRSIEKFSFEEIFNFSSGRNIKQNEASPDFKTPCVRYGELYHLYGEVIHNVVNNTNLPLSELLFSDGDEILLPSAGEDPLDIGSASALTIKGVAIGRTINILKPKDKHTYNQIFAVYYINAVLRKKISKLARGSSISNVYNSDLKTLAIHLPSIVEQCKIAAFLSAVDEKIAQLGQKKKWLETYKKGCMQQLFSQKIRFKDDKGRDFPDWEEKRLGEVADRVRQKNEKLTITGVLTNSAVHGVMRQEDYFDHDIANADNLDRYTIVQSGDFVYNPRISASAPVGPIKRNDLTTGVMSPLYDVFRFHKNENTGFWSHYYASTAWHKYMKQVANYGARHDRMAISSEDFFAMPLPCPHSNEQCKIADFLSAIETKITLVTEQLDQTKVFKKGLLQQMFI